MGRFRLQPGILDIVLNSGGGAPPLLTDSFNRADNANTLGTSDNGLAWSKLNPLFTKMGISSNQAYFSEVANDCSWVCDLGESDVDITCTVTLGSNAGHRKVGIALRNVDASNRIWAQLILTSTGTTVYRFDGTINGTNTSPSVSTPALQNNTSYTLRVVAVGKEIQMVVNGVLVHSRTLTDAEFGFIGAGTKHGIYFGLSDNGSRIDNITAVKAVSLPFDNSAVETRTYSSTIETITNLSMTIAHPQGRTNLPIVALMHGWSGDAGSFGNATLQRIASYGLFVVSVGMRGRNGASGTADASGREIHDIYDAIVAVRTLYASLVSDKAAVVGYSGGGGNAMAAACKFPDAWSVAISHFGMSDYGRDGTNGWYQNNGGSYAAEIATAVGGVPGAVPNNYYARDATAAIQNYTGGKLFLYHDKQDGSVPVVHSDRIKTAMDAAGLTNYALSETDTGDNPRWVHGYPTTGDPGAPNIQAEPTWTADILSRAAWTIPASGTVTVIGYIVTKRFSVWLNTGATLGVDAVATIVYNVATDTYTVTPLTTGAMDVTITQGAKSGGATNITETTEVVVS